MLTIDYIRCWEKPRTREGYYQIQGGIDMGIARAVAFAPYCDLLWMETAKPILKDAKKFAQGTNKHCIKFVTFIGVHMYHPGKWLAYNLSPSFNWDNAGMSDLQIQQYTDELGNLGFVWQFITLAGKQCFKFYHFVQVSMPMPLLLTHLPRTMRMVKRC